jgi:aerobic C4-dicarboxylate transport protein
MTSLALVLGLLLAYLFGPGHGMNIDPSTLDAKALNTYADNAQGLQGAGVGNFLLNVIPTTSFDALSRNDVLIRKSGRRFSLATNAKRLRGDHAQKIR